MNTIIKKVGKFELPEPFVPVREDGKPDVCPVDAFAGQSFNVNVFGHIQSDVSAMMQAQSKAEFDVIAQRLVEVQGENPDNSNLTDADLFKFHVGRYYQTPAEIAQMSESLTRKADERATRLAKEQAEKVAHEKALKEEKERYEAFKKAQAEKPVVESPKSE